MIPVSSHAFHRREAGGDEEYLATMLVQNQLTDRLKAGGVVGRQAALLLWHRFSPKSLDNYFHNSCLLSLDGDN